MVVVLEVVVLINTCKYIYTYVDVDMWCKCSGAACVQLRLYYSFSALVA